MDEPINKQTYEKADGNIYTKLKYLHGRLIENGHSNGISYNKNTKMTAYVYCLFEVQTDTDATQTDNRVAKRVVELSLMIFIHKVNILISSHNSVINSTSSSLINLRICFAKNTSFGHSNSSFFNFSTVWMTVSATKWYLTAKCIKLK